MMRMSVRECFVRVVSGALAKGQLNAHEVWVQNVCATSTARKKGEKLDKMVLSRNRTGKKNTKRAAMIPPNGFF
jgi:chorismate synthase